MDRVYLELLGRVVSISQSALASNAHAKAWLASRGIADARLLEAHRVGWAAGQLADLARGDALTRLRTLGLVNADGRDRFAEAVAIPAFDAEGAVVQIAFAGGDGRIAWLFPDETPVLWNAACLAQAREVAMAADPLAGLAALAGGRSAVVAPAGPGTPLGRAAKDSLLAHRPTMELLAGAERLACELEPLEIRIAGAAITQSGPGSRVVERTDDGFVVEFARRLRIGVAGLAQDSPRHLRASVRAYRRDGGGRVHVDTFDLYQARCRSSFAKTAGCLLGEDPIAIEEALMEVLRLAEARLRPDPGPACAVAVTEPERAESMKLLSDPKLLDRLLADLATFGHVGEEENKLVAYVASVSRKLDDPLSVLVVSRSAAGKSTLSDSVASLAPPEDVLRFTRLTAQTLYYQKRDALAHKLVVVEEAEGVEDAAYALRILQSSRKLSLSTAAGRSESKTHEVRGPVSLFVTTTRTDLDEETAGRFLTLSVDESVEQTRAILAAQRAAEAAPASDRAAILRVHQNAQRLLEPVAVANPYAPHLAFPDDRLSARRDHRKYLGLIRAVAFVHQHQRTREGGAIVATLEDIAIANRLAHAALGQSLCDLTPPSRRLLIELRTWVVERATRERVAPGALLFSQRELREKIGWKRTQLQEHVKELVQAEYLVAQQAGSGRRTRYALDWDGTGLDGERFYRGLVDVGALASPAAGQAAGSAGSGRGRSGRSKSTPKDTSDLTQTASHPSGRKAAER